MRQLHPVSFHERFVASGTYVFSQDDGPTGDVEHWTLHEPGKGALTVRADYDGRDGTGVHWLFEGLYNRALRRFERFDLSLYGTQHTDAKFIFGPGEAQISLRADGSARDRLDILLPDDAIVRAPALVADGLALGADNQTAPSFVPTLDLSAGLVQGGRIEVMTVAQQNSEMLTVDGREIEARVYHVQGDRESGYRCWLDRHDILLRRRWPSGLTAQLFQYVHRPETTT